MSGRTIIIGGGVIGISTLYELSALGIPATLLELHDGVALETSYANGSMMTPSMSDPWNSPGVWRHIGASLFDPYSPMKLRWRAIPGLAFWGLSFLRNSAPALYEKATKNIFEIAEYSTRSTEDLVRRLGIDCGFNDRGCMKIFENSESFVAAQNSAAGLKSRGLRFQILSPDEIVEVEPLLSGARSRLAGGLFFSADRSGDARQFTEGLAVAASQAGGEALTSIKVERLLVEDGKVVGVETSNGCIDAERIVICAGNGSSELAKQLDIYLPIKPVKGYSLTFQLMDGADLPRLPVVDDAMHAAVVPLGNRLRAVGTAEFTGFDRHLAPERLENLLLLFRRLYPTLADKIDLASQEPWTNFRPMTPDGLPIIGAAGPEGLYFNTGHGYLGWTMATGSARIIADMISGKKPDVDPTPYRVNR